DHSLIELGMQSHRVVHARTVLHEPRENVVDVADRECVIRAVVARRAFRTGAPAVPRFPHGVAVSDEEHVLGLRTAGDQDSHRVRVGEAGEVVKIAIRTVAVAHVAIAKLLGNRRQDRNRASAHHLHESPSAASEFVFAHQMSRRDYWRSAPRASYSSSWISCTPARTYSMTWEYRSEEHTSELQSRENLVCRLLLEKKKNIDI